MLFSRTGIIYVVNVDGTGVVRTGVTGHYPTWSPDGTQIAFSDDGIYVMNTAFTKHRLTLYNGDFVPRWSGDGRRIVFQRVEGLQYKLYVMNADGTGVTKISAGASDDWPTWSPQH